MHSTNSHAHLKGDNCDQRHRVSGPRANGRASSPAICYVMPRLVGQSAPLQKQLGLASAEMAGEWLRKTTVIDVFRAMARLPSRGRGLPALPR